MDLLKNLSVEDKWNSVVLDVVFTALASSAELSKMLIYKGARVLRLRLNENIRASFDIDACLSGLAINTDRPIDDAQLERIRKLVHGVVVDYFEAQEPVRYELIQSSIAPRRKLGPHPRGWDIYLLKLNVNDLSGQEDLSNQRGELIIDIAKPELTSENSVSPLAMDGYSIQAVTLERIAGEKLRAFLSHLPNYRRKIREKTQITRRVKDLYDLVRILRRRPITNLVFWRIAGQEFRLACESRLIDCIGLASFKDEWEETTIAYTADKTLPNDVTLDEVNLAIEQIAGLLEKDRITPFSFPMN
ncbi:MAG: nucleotidyl transferase AbiEii/AbiGii toxin family protein [Gemmatales bacterium]